MQQTDMQWQAPALVVSVSVFVAVSVFVVSAVALALATPVNDREAWPRECDDGDDGERGGDDGGGHDGDGVNVAVVALLPPS